MTRSPRSSSPKGDKARDRMLSPLRVGQSANETREAAEAASTSHGAPIITRTLPTADAFSDKEPDEFPFHIPPTAVDNRKSNARNPPSIRTGNGSTAPYPPLAPISRKPTAEGEESDAPRARRSVQFVRSNTNGESSTRPPGHSRQQSWDTDDEGAKKKERDKEKHSSSLITKLKALATPSVLQGHGRSQSAFASGPFSHYEGSPHGPLSAASERDELRYDGGHDSEADADAEEKEHPPLV
jgi:phospholipase D1/2